MQDLIDFFKGLWATISAFFRGLWHGLRGLSGVEKLRKANRDSAKERSLFGKIVYFGRPIVALIVILYLASLTVRFATIAGDELQYPQVILAEAPHAVPPGSPMNDGSGNCARSDIVAVTSYILDVLVNQNAWAPGDPQYKIGYFGLASFEAGPFWDNKASFQRGALRAVRRISIELVDLLGRARGTSAADQDLQDARGALQWNERAWIFNPFDERLPLISESAVTSYRRAIELLDGYNARLVACDGLFDSRSDNLFQLLDRIANDVGGLTDTLSQRSKAERWDVNLKRMVEGPGNNLGVFDTRADNFFYEAHGAMWAYHGMLQATRVDFGEVVRQSNLSQIWDRMEIHVAETAALDPAIISNGAEDSLFFPAHLSAMAVNMLRARANMTELREILNR